MSTPATTERLAGLIGEHATFGRAEQIHPADGPNCGWAVVRVCRCGNWSAPVMHDDSDRDAHRAHVATVLANAGVGFVAEAQAEALRETASAWQQGQWANVLRPVAPPAVPVIAHSNRVLDWLRERADHIGGAS